MRQEKFRIFCILGIQIKVHVSNIISNIISKLLKMVTFHLELDIEFPSPFYDFMHCGYGLGYLWNLLAISEWKLLQSKSYTIFFSLILAKSNKISDSFTFCVPVFSLKYEFYFLVFRWGCGGEESSGTELPSILSVPFHHRTASWAAHLPPDGPCGAGPGGNRLPHQQHPDPVLQGHFWAPHAGGERERVWWIR